MNHRLVPDGTRALAHILATYRFVPNGTWFIVSVISG